MNRVAREEDTDIADVLDGDFVLSLRQVVISELLTSIGLRNADPVKADELILSARQLTVQADEIEWLASRYVELGRKVELLARVRDSSREYVEQIIGQQLNP